MKTYSPMNSRCPKQNGSKKTVHICLVEKCGNVLNTTDLFIALSRQAMNDRISGIRWQFVLISTLNPKVASDGTPCFAINVAKCWILVTMAGIKNLGPPKGFRKIQ